MRRYGLIGYPLSHSFSKTYFAEKFAKNNITDCQYNNFPIASILEFPALIEAHKDLRGLNVTIPYKLQVIPFLHKKNEVVEKIGACNCIKIIDQKLYGYNTDVIGFEQSLLEYLEPHHQQALILGTGGAAKAVEYVLEKLGISYLYVSRTADNDKNVISYDQLNEKVISSHTLIINTTPLGTFPDIQTFPDIPYGLLTKKHYLFDLVYNPSLTVFLEKGKRQGATIKNGYDMLILQAEESWRIWNEV